MNKNSIMMGKTILITGTSSGIGRATVKYFANKGWQVAATMRSPEKESELQKVENVKLYALDVVNPSSIEKAISTIIEDFGALDVVVNNAGYGAVGIFEKASSEQIQKQFDVNVFGVMNVTRAVLPYFRSQKRGLIINVTSMGGRLTFPLYSVYHGTKWAIEGWAEAMNFELRPFGIRMKNVEPGAIKTDFYDRSMDIFENSAITDYDAYQHSVLKNTNEAGASAPGPELVAETIYKAAVDEKSSLRYPAGAQAKVLLFLRRLLPVKWFNAIVRMTVEKGLTQEIIS